MNDILNLFKCKRMYPGRKYNFTIKPGWHYSKGGGLIPDVCPKGQWCVKFNIEFSDNCDVEITDNPRQINKAIGLKEGLIPNKNSVLLGYSSYNGKFELWLFVNHDNNFEHIKIGDFNTGEVIGPFLMGMTKDQYYLDFNKKRYFIDRQGGSLPKQLGMVRSYFGGQKPNPKNNGTVNLKIDILGI